MKDYTPRPGSVPAQVIDYLRKNGPTRLSTIARALKKRGADLFPSLKAAMSRQLIFSAGAHGRVTVLHLPDQDPAQALAGAVNLPAGARPAAEADFWLESSSRNEEAPDLDIVIWSDGDVFVQGAGLNFVTDEAGDISGVKLSRPQARKLLKFLTQPLGAAA